ncbi:DUF488 family protein [Polluticoccus soli]|uniref:DUF488 domain-containing protein n=1 Tax=Polluticoccus soli TaxID=3034150 RepID=UPI0023E0AF78|nr:DUF488 domain-containing protein [Flavipsychrobacter sp. JY13-12]
MIYSIGYGNRNNAHFLSLLEQFNIQILIDIRTNPVSRFQPNYSKKRLEDYLSQNGVKYVFMGAELGGKPKDQSLYLNGKLSYDLVDKSPDYKTGIQKLIQLSEDVNTCIMCCELKPRECHRASMVGRTLLQLGTDVIHIDERGDIIPQSKL